MLVDEVSDEEVCEKVKLILKLPDDIKIEEDEKISFGLILDS